MKTRAVAGRLIQDRQEEIAQIIWRVDGKVKEIRRTPNSEKKNLIFDYNAFGQRIAKHVYNNQTDMLEKSTYYTLDAQGNQLSMYEHYVDESAVKYILSERNIYGSSRLGTLMDFVDMYNPDPIPSFGATGNRRYELNNHLGNVLMVITDQVYPVDENNDEEVDSYVVGLSNSFDYSPFGVQLDGRTMERTIQVCTEVTDEVTTYVLNETFDSAGSWQAISSSTPHTTITYLGGKMNVTKPSLVKFGPVGDIGASKQFTVGEGLHTVTFDIESNTCEVLQLPPASNSPRPFTVYIRDAANSIIATDSYVTISGSYSIQFTPTSSGSYTIEFLMNSAQNCSFSIDNVTISHQEEVSTVACGQYEGKYRYQFMGYEGDSEVKGNGNSYTTEFRQYDPRLGRWLSLDPRKEKYPDLSPYVAFANNPIWFTDTDGDTIRITTESGAVITYTPLMEIPTDADIFTQDVITGLNYMYRNNDIARRRIGFLHQHHSTVRIFQAIDNLFDPDQITYKGKTFYKLQFNNLLAFQVNGGGWQNPLSGLMHELDHAWLLLYANEMLSVLNPNSKAYKFWDLARVNLHNRPFDDDKIEELRATIDPTSLERQVSKETNSAIRTEYSNPTDVRITGCVTCTNEIDDDKKTSKALDYESKTKTAINNNKGQSRKFE